MRQLTVPTADWGRAFSACPPASIVATHVVRSLPTYEGLPAIRAAAARSLGLAANFSIAAPSGPGVSAPAARKSPSVQALVMIGNW